MSEFIVTGLSGAGRSQAPDTRGPRVGSSSTTCRRRSSRRCPSWPAAPGSSIAGRARRRARAHTRRGAPGAGHAQGGRPRVRILFLEASTDVLVRRYEQHAPPPPARRRAGGAGRGDRARAAAPRAGQGRSRRGGRHQRPQRPPAPRPHARPFGDEAPAPGMQTTVMSFGYKHGLPARRRPRDRLPLPAEPALGRGPAPLSGLDPEVRDYVLQQEATGEFLDQLDVLLDLLLPAYVREGKSYLTLAFGCTGGRHRSVASPTRSPAGSRERAYRPQGPAPRHRPPTTSSAHWSVVASQRCTWPRDNRERGQA